MLEGLTEIAHASKPSKTCLVIVGSVHGNEPAGRLAVERITHMHSTGAWHIDGDVYGLIGNPRAIEKRLRFTEENLNRAFGHAVNPASYEAARAREIAAWFKELSVHYDNMHLLDLHSVSMGETRIAIYNAAHPRSGPWCKEVSPIPFFIGETDEVIPGTLTIAFEKMGGTAIAIECGNHVSDTAELVALEHAERALLSLGMLGAHEPTFQGAVAYEGVPRTYRLIAPIKPHRGFAWDMTVASESFVAQGVQFAHDENGPHIAADDCYIMMPSKIPQPEDFDAGFLARKEA